MNILYLGPFQKNNALGYSSSVILQKLCDLSNCQVYAHPIYSGLDNPSVSNIPYFRFKDIKKYPDINIQYSTVNSLYIDTYSKNYFIPIHPMNLEIPKQYHAKLKALDKILVYSDFELDKFLNIGIEQDKLCKLELPSTKISENKLNLGIYNSYYKYYFIGDYINNEKIIKSLIKNFLPLSKTQNNICLIVASDCNDQQRQEIVKFYEQQKKDMLLENYEDKVLLLVDDVGCDRINSLHNAGDVYLCLNDGHYPLTDAAAATACKSDIIQYPTDGLDKEYIYNNLFHTITNNKIQEIISNTKENIQTENKYPVNKLEEILC